MNALIFLVDKFVGSISQSLWFSPHALRDFVSVSVAL